MIVSTGKNQREIFHDLSMPNPGETSIFSLSKNRDLPISSTISTALAITAVASCVFALANELGWISTSNERPDPSDGNFFGNASVIPYNSNANTISSPSQPSSSCIQNVALGSLGMLITQSIWPLVSTLFGCLAQANAQTTTVTYPSLLDCPPGSTFYYTPGQTPLFFSQTTGTDPILGLPNGDTLSIYATVDNIYPGEAINIAPSTCNFFLDNVYELTFNYCHYSDIAKALKNFSYTNNWSVVPVGASRTRDLKLNISSSMTGTSSECKYKVLIGSQLPTQAPPSSTITTTNSSTTADSNSSTVANTDLQSEDSSTKYMIIGGAVGGVALLGGTALGVYCLKKKKKQREALGKELRLMHEFKSGDSTLDPKSSYSLHEIESSASLHSGLKGSRSFSVRNDSTLTTPSSEDQFARKEMLGAIGKAVVSEASADPQDVQIVIHSVGGAISEGFNEIAKKFGEDA